MRERYRPEVFLKNDYLYHVGGYPLGMVTAAPKQKTDYRTVTNPFDSYVWVFTMISVLSVNAAFIVIDKANAFWMTGTTKTQMHLSNIHMRFE